MNANAWNTTSCDKVLNQHKGKQSHIEMIQDIDLSNNRNDDAAVLMDDNFGYLDSLMEHNSDQDNDDFLSMFPSIDPNDFSFQSHAFQLHLCVCGWMYIYVVSSVHCMQLYPSMK